MTGDVFWIDRPGFLEPRGYWNNPGLVLLRLVRRCRRILAIYNEVTQNCVASTKRNHCRPDSDPHARQSGVLPKFYTMNYFLSCLEVFDAANT